MPIKLCFGFPVILPIVAIRCGGSRASHVMCAGALMNCAHFVKNESRGPVGPREAKGVFPPDSLDVLVGMYASDSLWESQFHLSRLSWILSGEGDLGGPSKLSWSFKNLLPNFQN